MSARHAHPSVSCVFESGVVSCLRPVSGVFESAVVSPVSLRVDLCGDLSHVSLRSDLFVFFDVSLLRPVSCVFESGVMSLRVESGVVSLRVELCVVFDLSLVSLRVDLRL